MFGFPRPTGGASAAPQHAAERHGRGRASFESGSNVSNVLRSLLRVGLGEGPAPAAIRDSHNVYYGTKRWHFRNAAAREKAAAPITRRRLRQDWPVAPPRVCATRKGPSSPSRNCAKLLSGSDVHRGAGGYVSVDPFSVVSTHMDTPVGLHVERAFVKSFGTVESNKEIHLCTFISCLSG